MIVKIFFMDVLTQAYAHLEFDSKLDSAKAMVWISSTSLGQSNMTGKNAEKADVHP